MGGQHGDRILEFDGFSATSCEPPIPTDFFMTRFDLMIQHSSQIYSLMCEEIH
jgi:hypothetical protein